MKNTLVILVLLGGCLFCRLWAFDRLPGINGDEAWYGAQIRRVLSGEMGSLLTPSGLPMNPLHVVPLLLIEMVFEPDFLNLRLPSLASGLAVILASFFLMKNLLGAPRAFLLALLVGVLPLHIAYSRFGWDASHTPLVSLLCLYFCLKRNWWALCGSFILAMWVHPTNIFLLPIVLGPLVGHFLSQSRAQKLISQHKIMIFTLVILLTAIVFWVIQFVPLSMINTEAMVERFFYPDRFGELFLKYGRLLTGATVYQYLVGPLSESFLLFFDIFFVVVSGVLLLTGIPYLIRQRQTDGLGLLVGLAVAVGGQYIVSGWLPLNPSTERYGAFLTVPSCLTAIYLLAPQLIQGHPIKKEDFRRLSGGICLSFVLLVSFGYFYLFTLSTTGGDSEETFRTGSQEPKQAALKWIEKQVPSGPLIIATDSWWTRWPLEYLTSHKKQTQIISFKDPLLSQVAQTQTPVFAVGFQEKTFHRYLPKGTQPLLKQIVLDPQNQPILQVWRLN